MAKEREREKNTSKKDEEQLYKRKIEIQVLSPIIAPALPSIKAFKMKKIETIELCYKEHYRDSPELQKILETVKHLDRAFERTVVKIDNKTLCQAFLPGSTISGFLQQQLNDPTVYVRGIVPIPMENIIIDLKKRADALLVTEEIVPGTVLTAEVLVNKDITKSLVGPMASMRQKGYGQILLSFAPP